MDPPRRIAACIQRRSLRWRCDADEIQQPIDNQKLQKHARSMSCQCMLNTLIEFSTNDVLTKQDPALSPHYRKADLSFTISVIASPPGA